MYYEISRFARCEIKFALNICEANISQRSYFISEGYFTRRRRISLKKARFGVLFSWRRARDFFGDCRRLRVASLLDHVGEHSPPDCVLPQTSFAPSLFESLVANQKIKSIAFATLYCDCTKEQHILL